MRVLVVHNRYRAAVPSGENRVVDAEIAALAAAGVDVGTYFRDSDDIAGYGLVAKVGVAVRPVYSAPDVREFRNRLRSFRPDVVHLHNPYPLISPAVVRVARAEGVPVVQTVHNVRHACVAGTFFRAGAVCEDCRGRTVPTPAVRHGCYRGSRLQTVPMAVAAVVHRSTWSLVDRYLPVSDYLAGVLESTGVPRARITVKPNGVADPGAPTPPGDGFLFCGRLDPEKGLGLLLDVWRGLGLDASLTIAGNGPLRPEVEAAAADPTANVRDVGRLDAAGVQAALRAHAVAVVPTLCLEGMGLAAVEAFAAGRAVIATDMGGLPEVTAGLGWTIPPDAAALATALRAAHADRAAVEEFGRAGRARYVERYRADDMLACLTATYESVVVSRTPSGR